MADERNTGAAIAAAAWCANNLLNTEKCSPQQKNKFPNALAALIRQEFNLYDDPNIACVIQVKNKEPNKILNNALSQFNLTSEALSVTDIIVLVYPSLVWVDEDCNNYSSKKQPCKCIYQEVSTSNIKRKKMQH